MQACEQVMYYVAKDFFILKLIGTLRFTLAPTLAKALSNLTNAHPVKDVIIDLSEAKYLDSTILGNIVKFFLQEENQHLYLKNHPIIVCQNDDVIQTFHKIGFDKFFTFVPVEERVMRPLADFLKVEETTQDAQELEEHILKAHQTLHVLKPKDSALKLVIEFLKHK